MALEAQMETLEASLQAVKQNLAYLAEQKPAGDGATNA